MQEYFIAKKRIFKNQTKEDFLILNSGDSNLKDIALETKATVKFFSQKENLNPNQAAVMTVAEILGINEKLVRQVFSDFKGIEHRMEYIRDLSGIKFINDSKATTVDSALWALNNINSKIILIAGGRDKGSDYSLVVKEAFKKIKEVVLIGEAKTKIRAAFSGFSAISDAATLEEAVRIAYAKASPGDYILFSPMCSSFDMFKDYEDRGRVFKKAVLDLAERAK
jgi:UDP-N-acetylmuramoylalanine--D-glutamate ligase